MREIKFNTKKGYISRKGFPEDNKNYPEAHSEASNAEKKNFPRGYLRLKRLSKKVPQGEMIGNNSKSGKITVSDKVPKKLRPEVAFHEKKESLALKRLKKKR